MLWSTTVCTCCRDLQKLPSWETHILLLVCRAAVSMLRVAQWPSRRAQSVETEEAGCTFVLKIAHRSDGKIADVLASTHTCSTANASVNYTAGMCRRDLQCFHRPHGRLSLARCLQGGGVFVNGGTVTLSSCTISGNTADLVRTHLQKFPRPDGRLTFCSLFAGRRCLCQWWLSEI